MWSFLTGLLPFLSIIANWWQGKAQAETDATNAEGTAETQHQNDGAQSVDDKDSADAQNTALDDLKEGLSNPTPVIVKDKP